MNDRFPPGILPDHEIRRLATKSQNPMIYPFTESLRQAGVISSGLSSFGYDATLAKDYKIFRQKPGAIVDPKNFDEDICETFSGDTCIIPPNGFLLGYTQEFFDIPKDIMVVCVGKSTYARCGLIVNVTPLEAEWSGQVVIEISNTTPLPAIVYGGEGVCQFMFFRGTSNPEVTYKDRAGKYMGQTGITLPRIAK